VLGRDEHSLDHVVTIERHPDQFIVFHCQPDGVEVNEMLEKHLFVNATTNRRQQLGSTALVARRVHRFAP
jgi:hypothetical protein